MNTRLVWIGAGVAGVALLAFVVWIFLLRPAPSITTQIDTSGSLGTSDTRTNTGVAEGAGGENEPLSVQETQK